MTLAVTNQSSKATQEPNCRLRQVQLIHQRLAIDFHEGLLCVGLQLGEFTGRREAFQP